MKLCDQIQIIASPEQIWCWLEKPERMMAWNSKLISVRPVSNFTPRMGYLYQARYRLSKNETEFSGEIIQFQPGRLWSSEFKNPLGEKVSRGCVIQESYELVTSSSTSSRTTVKQTITIQNSGIPWIFQLLIKGIQAFGSPAGKDNLYKLKELVEKKAPFPP